MEVRKSPGTGIQWLTKPEEADAIMELRSGGVGTDVTSSYLGIPGFTVPGMIGIPDIKIVNRDSQKAVAKLGIVVYDVNSKHELGEGGVSMAKADDTNTYVLGIGPHQSGSLLNEVNRGTALDPKQQVREFPNEVTFSPADYEDDPVQNRRVRLSGGYRRD